MGSLTTVQSAETLAQGGAELQAVCPVGDEATGGGYNGTAGIQVVASAPFYNNAQPVGWSIEAINTTSTPISVTVIAVCASS